MIKPLETDWRKLSDGNPPANSLLWLAWTEDDRRARHVTLGRSDSFFRLFLMGSDVPMSRATHFIVLEFPPHPVDSDVRPSALMRAAGEICDELEDRYDGAPDSNTKWMGEHIENLRRALPKEKP